MKFYFADGIKLLTFLLLCDTSMAGGLSATNQLEKIWSEQQGVKLINAAHGGHYRAQLALADLALRQEASANTDWTEYWLEQAAKSSRPEALYLLAKVLMLKDPERQNFSRAIELLEQSAEQEWIPAQVLLADLIYDQAPQRALAWYHAAADMNNSQAQLRLGKMAFLKQEYDQALYWLNKAAEIESQALFLTAAIHMQNLSSYQQGVEVISLLSRAYDRGYKPALLLLARCYAEGVGVEQSTRYTRELLHTAINEGVPEAEACYSAIHSMA